LDTAVSTVPFNVTTEFFVSTSIGSVLKPGSATIAALTLAEMASSSALFAADVVALSVGELSVAEAILSAAGLVFWPTGCEDWSPHPVVRNGAPANKATSTAIRVCAFIIVSFGGALPRPQGCDPDADWLIAS
jgi:hypothetical protein